MNRYCVGKGCEKVGGRGVVGERWDNVLIRIYYTQHAT